MKREIELSSYFNRIFALMFLGIALTFGIGFYLTTTGAGIELLDRYLIFWPIVFVLEIGCVIGIKLALRKWREKTSLSLILFIIHSCLMGGTIGIVLTMYSVRSVVFAFLGALILFGTFVLVGFITKDAFLSYGKILRVGLIALLVVTLVNVFLLRSSLLELVLSWVGLLLFLGLTAFDIQYLRAAYYDSDYSTGALIVSGALELYLDFINIFLDLLRIFGRRD